MIRFVLLLLAIIGLNEYGYGVFSLPLLFPAAWLLYNEIKKTERLGHE